MFAAMREPEPFEDGRDVIIANRWSDELSDVAGKVYTGSLFKRGSIASPTVRV